MGGIFSAPEAPAPPPPPPPPPPAANPPVYAGRTQGSSPRRSTGVPGFNDTVRTDPMGGDRPRTEVRQLMGG